MGNLFKPSLFYDHVSLAGVPCILEIYDGTFFITV